jgi:hypothetical protein
MGRQTGRWESGRKGSRAVYVQDWFTSRHRGQTMKEEKTDLTGPWIEGSIGKGQRTDG